MILSFLLMIVSILLFTFISVLGVIYTLLRALFTLDSTNLKRMYKNGVYQTKLFFTGIAIVADEYGNIYCGELLEYLCCYNRNTLFLDSDTTVSASLGYIEAYGKFTRFGYALRSLLNRTFEPNHCLNAYEYLERYKAVKDTNEFNNWLNRSK